jgi:hypothetical protein
MNAIIEWILLELTFDVAERQCIDRQPIDRRSIFYVDLDRSHRDYRARISLHFSSRQHRFHLCQWNRLPMITYIVDTFSCLI